MAELKIMRPQALPGPSPETVWTQAIDEIRREREITTAAIAALDTRHEEAVRLARAEERAKAKKDDIWLIVGGMAAGILLTGAVLAITSSLIGRQTLEAATQGIVIGKAEAEHDALMERSKEPNPDQGYKRTPEGWRK